MANPLRWFRRHQKLMMVFFGVGLMAVFGLGSVVTMVNPGDMSVQRDNPTIATWKGGDITREDLDVLRIRHFQTMRFLDGLQQAARKEKGDNFQSLAIPIQSVVSGNQFNQEEVDRRLLDKFLMAELAKEEGIIVDDFMVEEYLAQVRGYVPMSRNDMKAINQEINQGRAAMEVVRRHLRLELAAQQMSNLAAVSIAGANPTQPRVPNPSDAIELYTKSNRQVEAQVYQIPVSTDAISEEPPASEIRKLYEEGKFSYSGYDLDKPGFKVGKTVRVQYFVANRDNFLENEMNKITDAQLQEEYDRLVKEESPIVMEIIPEEPKLTDPTEQPSVDDPAPLIPDPLVPDENEGDDEAPALPEGGETVSGPDGDTVETPETTESGEGKGNQDESGQEDGGLSFNVTPTSDRLVSMVVQEETKKESEEAAQEKTDESAKKEAPAEETATQDKAETEKQETAEDQPTEPPKSTKDAPQEPGAEATDDAPESKQDETNRPSKAELQEKLQPPMLKTEKPKEIKRRPKALIDCAREIKESMCRKAANDAMSAALDKATAKIGVYRMRYTRWKFDDEGTRGEEPEAPNFQELADENLLEFRETDLVDINQLIEEEIGKIRVFRQTLGPDGRPQPMFPSIAELIFSNFSDVNEYDPAKESDATAGYAYWLAEKQDARIPELNEVKDEIIEFWKKRKALDKAMAEAKEIADGINATEGTTLAGKYPAKAVSTGSFSWFNSAAGQPRISTPNGTTDVGDEFMKAVFALDQYKAGVAANETRDSVYVIQLVSEKESLAASGKDYLENRFFKFKTVPTDVRNINMWYTLDLYRNWNETFADRMDLELVGQ